MVKLSTRNWLKKCTQRRPPLVLVALILFRHFQYLRGSTFPSGTCTWYACTSTSSTLVSNLVSTVLRPLSLDQWRYSNICTCTSTSTDSSWVQSDVRVQVRTCTCTSTIVARLPNFPGLQYFKTLSRLLYCVPFTFVFSFWIITVIYREKENIVTLHFAIVSRQSLDCSNSPTIRFYAWRKSYIEELCYFFFLSGFLNYKKTYFFMSELIHVCEILRSDPWRLICTFSLLLER